MDLQPVFPPNAYITEVGIALLKNVFKGGQASIWSARRVNAPAGQGVPEIAVRINAIPSARRGEPVYVRWIGQLNKETDIWRSFSAASIFVLKLEGDYYIKNFQAENGIFDLYIQAMEWVPYGSLEEHMFQHGRAVFLNLLGSPSRILAFMRNIASGIKSGHDKGYIHGDIKPANILLHVEPASAYPKVMDFGLSRPTSDLTRLSGFQGTPEYAHPKVLQNLQKPNASSDIFSLGIVYLELLTGRRWVNFTQGMSLADRTAAVLQRYEDRANLRPYEITPDLGFSDERCLQLVNLINHMMSVDVEGGKGNISLESVIRTIISLEQRGGERPASLTSRQFVFRDTYRWSKFCHDAVPEWPVYFTLTSDRPWEDEQAIQDAFRGAGINGYSIYRLVGEHDYMLRIWARAETELLIEGAVNNFLRARGTSVSASKIEVRDYRTFDNEKPKGVVNFEELSSLLSEASSTDEGEEFLKLRSRGLVKSRLNDDRNGTTAIRVFLFVLVNREELDEITWRAFDSELRSRLAVFEKPNRLLNQKRIIKNVSSYRCVVRKLGSGDAPQCGVLFRFVLNSYHEYGRIIQSVFDDREAYERMAKAPMRTSSFFELDRTGVRESDDGGILDLALQVHEANLQN